MRRQPPLLLVSGRFGSKCDSDTDAPESHVVRAFSSFREAK